MRGGFPPQGGLDAGEWPPLMSDTQRKCPWPIRVMWGPGFQKHRSRCCLMALPASSWVVGSGVGRALPPKKGCCDTKHLKLHGCPPIQQAYAGLLGATAGRIPTWAGPLVDEKPLENCYEGRISPQGGLDVGEWPPLMSDTQCKGPWPMQAMWGPGFQKHRSRWVKVLFARW